MITNGPARLTDAQLSAYFAKNPPPAGKDGKDVTQPQIDQAVAAYIAAHPPSNGKDGASATNAQVSGAVAAYMQANPPAAGKDGKDATEAQVVMAVSAYLASNPPAPGKNATTEQIASAVSAYLIANPPAKGKDGTNGISGTNGTNGKDGIVPIYNASGLRAGQKMWVGTVMSDTAGNWSANFAAAGFTAPPVVQANAININNTPAGVVVASFTAPTATGVSGICTVPQTVSILGVLTIKLASAAAQVHVTAIGS